MNEDQFSSPQDSLLLIERMINKAQNRFNENGHLYLLWGWLIFFCSILSFVLSYWNLYDRPYHVWFLTWLALIYQVFYIVRRKKKERVKTYTDEIIGYIWFVFVMLMILVGFVTGKANAWALMYPLFLILYGIPTFLIGALVKFSPLRAGAVSCWVLAIISTYVPVQYQVLFFSVAVLSAWIIPGYLLRSRFKNQH